MRPSSAAVLALSLAAPLPLAAQSRAPDGVFTPAPVPGVTGGAVTPADRAGSGPGQRATDAGPSDSTPFSAAPSGTLGANDMRGGVGSTGRAGGPIQNIVPNVEK